MKQQHALIADARGRRVRLLARAAQRRRRVSIELVTRARHEWERLCGAMIPYAGVLSPCSLLWLSLAAPALLIVP
jgi:hypothetical protein